MIPFGHLRRWKWGCCRLYVVVCWAMLEMALVKLPVHVVLGVMGARVLGRVILV